MIIEWKEVKQMGTIKDEAMNYQPTSSVNNISELNEITTDIVLFDDTDAEFPYKYFEQDNKRYKMPSSVLASLKEMLKANPNMKKFNVNKTGQGMNTKYFVIPLG